MQQVWEINPESCFSISMIPLCSSLYFSPSMYPTLLAIKSCVSKVSCFLHSSFSLINSCSSGASSLPRREGARGAAPDRSYRLPLPSMTGDRFVSYFCELNYSPTYLCEPLQQHVSAVGAILLFHYTFDNLFESFISKVVHHL